MSVTSTVRWGILGCGAIATNAVAPAIRWSNNGRLGAVASRDAATAARKAAELGADRAHSYEALLADPEIDAIYIGLPNGLHERWALRAAEAGKHVLCDKSLTLSAASARRLRDAFAARGLRLVEGFMYRHHPQWNVVRRLLADGAVGEVRFVEATLAGRCPPDDHRWSPELGGGVLYDVACYGVDVARFLTGAEPARVSAVGVAHPSGVDRAVTIALELPSGVLASASGSLETEHAERLTIVGTHGRLDVERPFDPGWDEAAIVLRRNWHVERIAGPGANQFLHQMEHFARLVRDPSAPAAPAEDGVANAIALDAVRESRASGATVPLAQNPERVANRSR